MQKIITIVFFCFVLASGNLSANSILVERGNDLQSVIDYAVSGDTIYVGAKSFEARATKFTDSLCGNCGDPKTSSSASYGFIVRNKSLHIIGIDRTNSILVTNGGYGIFFVNSPESELSNLTVTGGRRDVDGNATDAAIVIRNSKVSISKVDIINNVHRIDSVIVGIGGIFGREGAELTISDCRIENNGWDGIALYRGASAVISDCLIKDGRGAGIGVTWDATCFAYRNEVTGFWKGIGAFGTSWVVARNNLVHNNLGWGMIATGRSYMDMTNNVIHYNGNCGIAPWSTNSRGRIVNNIITQNGWRKQWVCPCVGVWNYGDWAKWEFSHNIVWNNKDDQYFDIWDQTGLNGNLTVDPEFVGAVYFNWPDSGVITDSTNYSIQGIFNFKIKEASPANHAGDSLTFNINGSRSDIGLTGGPQAKRQ